MPPASSQKGTGKKGANAISRQRSRNTTPSSVPLPASLPPIETKQTEYLDLNYDSFRNITYEDVVDQNASSSLMPESKSLDGIMSRFQKLNETIEKRSSFCDRGMRLLVSALRARMDEVAAERSREEERLRREAAEDEERARKANKANKKKRKAADTLAPQDANIGQLGLFRAVHILSILLPLMKVGTRCIVAVVCWTVFCALSLSLIYRPFQTWLWLYLLAFK